MYKVMIIDDDKNAIEDIYRIFNWKSLSVTEIIKVYDISNLTEKIRQEAPDIVMIDIEMGNVSGLDIIEQCKNSGSDALFVIISGHCNFSYAKTAIKLDVVHFLSKPLMEYDVYEATEKLIDRLNLKAKNTSELIDDVGVFLSGKYEFNNFIKNSSLVFPGAYKFIVVDVNDVVLEEIDRLCLGESLCLKYKIGTRKYLFVVNCDKYTQKNEICLKSVSVTRRVSVGISEEFNDINDAYSRFKQAYILSFGKFVYNRNDVFKYELVNKDVSRDFSQRCFQCLESLEQGKIDEFEEFIKGVPDYFKTKNVDFEHLMFFYNSVVYKINSLTKHKKYGEFVSVQSVENIVVEYSSLENMCNELWVLIKEVLVDSTSVVQDDSGVFEEILKYMSNNYDQRLSLEMIGEQFNVSISYICKHFKEKLDMTFLEYLTRIRIERAQSMLKNTSLSIAEIVEKVGYTDYFYFNKLFKTYTGYTPRKYKNIQRGSTDEN